MSVSDAPLHKVAGAAEAVTSEGTSLIDTTAVTAVVLPQVLDAVSVYMPADRVQVVKADGLRLVDVNPFGPLHANDVAPVAVAVSVRDAPLQRVVAEGMAVTEVGTVFIVMADVVTVALPQLLVATNVYTPAEAVPVVIAAGLRTNDVNPPGPLQV